MAFSITKEWLINLSEDFDSRVEEGKLIYWKSGITVIAVPFRLPEGTDKLSLLKQIQEKMPADTLETMVSTKGEIVGLGYTRINNEQNEIKRLSLYTFTASDTSCLQIAFYLDNPDGLPWAKSVWERLIFHPAE
ncbi:MAG TPA: hypothetical protein PLE10_08065 [Brevefilum sp.]|nr:hypothetical protein [Brevefilum sp.]HOR19762.1 hypothetical protein [Brevefilum sp.]HPL70128.1 hypothetical protein [Brevefilum sp.]